MKRPRIRPDLEAAVDQARGDVPLERWINRLIERELERLANASKGASPKRAKRK